MATSLTLTVLHTSKPDWTMTVVRQDPKEPLVSLGEMSEADLVAACLADRAGAFDLVVERHRRAVYQLCYRFVGNHEDASDLSQDVFLRAYKGLGNFRGQSSMATWLYRIGVNVCLNHVSAKRLATEPETGQDHPDSRSETAPERLLRDERAARVRAAVAALPEKQRTVLVLRIYQELSHQEIADIVGTTVGAVKANVFHALRNLRKRLGREAL